MQTTPNQYFKENIVWNILVIKRQEGHVVYTLNTQNDWTKKLFVSVVALFCERDKYIKSNKQIGQISL